MEKMLAKRVGSFKKNPVVVPGSYVVRARKANLPRCEFWSMSDGGGSKSAPFAVCRLPMEGISAKAQRLGGVASRVRQFKTSMEAAATGTATSNHNSAQLDNNRGLHVPRPKSHPSHLNDLTLCTSFCTKRWPGADPRVAQDTPVYAARTLTDFHLRYFSSLQAPTVPYSVP